MSDMDFEETYSIGTTEWGWICDRCGAFVKWTEGHECPKPNTSTLSSNKNDEIVNLLRQILQELRLIKGRL